MPKPSPELIPPYWALRPSQGWDAPPSSRHARRTFTARRPALIRWAANALKSVRLKSCSEPALTHRLGALSPTTKGSTPQTSISQPLVTPRIWGRASGLPASQHVEIRGLPRRKLDLRLRKASVTYTTFLSLATLLATKYHALPRTRQLSKDYRECVHIPNM